MNMGREVATGIAGWFGLLAGACGLSSLLNARKEAQEQPPVWAEVVKPPGRPPIRKGR